MKRESGNERTCTNGPEHVNWPAADANMTLNLGDPLEIRIDHESFYPNRKHYSFWEALRCVEAYYSGRACKCQSLEGSVGYCNHPLVSVIESRVQELVEHYDCIPQEALRAISRDLRQVTSVQPIGYFEKKKGIKMEPVKKLKF